MKKRLLLLTTTAAIVAPIAAVMSCGTQKSKNSQHKKPAKTGNPQNINKTQGVTVDNGPKLPNDISVAWKQLTRPTIIPQPLDWTLQTKPTIIPQPVDWTLQTKPTIIPQPVDWTLQTKPTIIPQPVDWTLQTKPTVIPPVQPSAQSELKPSTIAVNNIDSSDKALEVFKVTNITEDPHIDGYLDDVDHTPRNFRQYDNGLFKIKIETSLIGKNKYYGDESKADLQAKTIADSISIGPAVTHLPKGIQILQSAAPASLGGGAGVQISETNSNGTPDDEGIKNQASLVDHEYGHHETMWDFQNIIGGALDDGKDAYSLTMRKVMANAFAKSGYPAISKQITSSSPKKENELGFIPAPDNSMPTDYGVIKGMGHQIFGTPDYPFNAEEIATRALNILSCRVTWDAKTLYEGGNVGQYPPNGPFVISFEPPAAFVSDATIRHFTGDSIFGGGKDNSRTDKLIKAYEDDIFGYNKGLITMFGDPNSGKSMTKIEINDFGTIPNLASLEIQDTSGKVIEQQIATTYNSRMGFKDELVSNDWNRRFTKPVTQINDFTFDIKHANGFKVIGRNKFGKIIDITRLRQHSLQSSDGTLSYPGFTGLVPQGDYFTIKCS